MAAYDQDLTDAEQLPGWAHWLVGCGLALAGALFENPTAWPDALLFASLMGIPLSIASRHLIMRALPQPYAWCAKQTGLAQPAA